MNNNNAEMQPMITATAEEVCLLHIENVFLRISVVSHAYWSSLSVK